MHSVAKALAYVGAEVRRVTRPEELKDAPAVVLPGVGAFDDCMNALQRQEMLEAARSFAAWGRPFLGICVGYQALFQRSEEFNSSAAGLGLFRGKVVRFSGQNGLKVPQIGWNEVAFSQPDCPLFRGIRDRSYFYFVHSYYPEPEESAIIAGRTEYGESFASVICQGHIYATQFHPEKSQKAGLQLLRNFVEIAKQP